MAGAVGAVIEAVGDFGEEAIKAVAQVLSQPITLKFSPGNGYRLKGRWRKKNDRRLVMESITVPLALPVVILWLMGWRPTGKLGQFLAWLMGAGKPLFPGGDLLAGPKDIVRQLDPATAGYQAQGLDRIIAGLVKSLLPPPPPKA